jgi:hypothetical protein
MAGAGMSQIAGTTAFLAPPWEVPCAAMRRLLTPASAGLSAARHLVWYFGYQISGSRFDEAR